MNTVVSRARPIPVMASTSWTGSVDLYPVTQDTPERGRRPVLDKPTWAMLPQTRQRAMLSDARYLYGQCPQVSGASLRVADYAVGWAWQPRYTGTDARWRGLAETVINRWLDVCDVRGGQYNWRTGLRNACMAIDRDGDIFAVKTKDPVSGGPRLQWVTADRIGQPVAYQTAGQWAKVPDSPETRAYAGMHCSCGIVFDEAMRPVAYNVMPYEGIGVSYTWNLVPAESVIWIHDPKHVDQVRGIPSVASAILSWYDLNETVTAEVIAAKINSSLAMIEKNETGRRELAREAIGASNLPTAGRTGILETKTFERGLIRYIKTSGSIEAHRNDRPSNGWLALMEHLTRGAFLGMGLPYEFAWDSSKIGGAGVRSMVGQVQRMIEARQHVLETPARAALLYAVASYMDRGDLPFTADWDKWEFSLPSLFSVDMGRDSQNRREDFAVGLR